MNIDWSQFQRIAQPNRQGMAIVEGQNIYILPTSYGLLYALLVMVLVVGAVNYDNNPAFLLAFLMLGVGINALFQTWNNLRQLEVKFLSVPEVFCGDAAFFRFLLSHETLRQCPAIQLYWAGQQHCCIDVKAEQSHCSAPFLTLKRGYLAPGKMTIETVFPLGLFKAWAYIDTAASVLVYPKPVDGWQAPVSASFKGNVSGDLGVGVDDFVGHKNYRPGDSPRHINWKLLAGEKGLFIKQFGGDRIEQQRLDWADLSNGSVEHRLSLLTAAVIMLEQQQQFYELHLPHGFVDVGRGEKHKMQCLRLLALFGETT